MKRNLKLINVNLVPLPPEGHTNKKIEKIVRKYNDEGITEKEKKSGLDTEVNVEVDLEKLHRSKETGELRTLINRTIKQIEKCRKK